MELPEDLFQPRRNEDVETTIRAIRKDVAFLARAKDHAARRGAAYVLIAHLEHLVESPEFLSPLLAEGAVEPEGCWLPEDVVTARGLHLSGGRPFDAGGHGFFVEFLGRLSPLFDPLPPGPTSFDGFPGTSVSVLRLDHTTPTATTRHLTERSALARVAEAAGLVAAPPTARRPRLYCDPRGYAARGAAVQDSLEIGAAADVASAVATADELSAALGIRLVVATVERFVDNH